MDATEGGTVVLTAGGMVVLTAGGNVVVGAVGVGGIENCVGVGSVVVGIGGCVSGGNVVLVLDVVVVQLPS